MTTPHTPARGPSLPPYDPKYVPEYARRRPVNLYRVTYDLIVWTARASVAALLCWWLGHALWRVVTEGPGFIIAAKQRERGLDGLIAMADGIGVFVWCGVAILAARHGWIVLRVRAGVLSRREIVRERRREREAGWY